MEAIFVNPTHPTSEGCLIRIGSDNCTEYTVFDNTITLGIDTGLSHTQIYLSPNDAETIIAALKSAEADLHRKAYEAEAVLLENLSIEARNSQ